MRSKLFSCLFAFICILWSFAPKFDWSVYALNKPGSYSHLSAFNKITIAPPSQITDQQSSVGTIATVAGGFIGDNGPAAGSSLNIPAITALDSSGNLFIADTLNHRIRRIDAATGVIMTVAGNGISGFSGDNGLAASASLNGPEGVAIDSSGNLFIADSNSNRIRRVNAVTGVISTVAGNGFGGFSGDNGLAASASLNGPRGIAIDSLGNLFIADFNNQRIRRVNAATGFITTVAGNGSASFSGDNGLAASASLNGPRNIAIDSSGNLFIADSNSHRIRRVNAATGVITTVVGNGNRGFSGDNGTAASASLNFPFGVTIDSSGNLFIADFNNQRIRRVNAATSVITTVVGNGFGGFSGDNGPAVSASLNFPRSIAIDSSGNLFIADSNSNRIRRVNAATGVITTVAGNGIVIGDNGLAASASLNGPEGVAIDSSGNLFITESTSNRIRKVNAATGVITTVAGNGFSGFSGDNGPAASASLNGPEGIAIDSSGNLFFAEFNNQRIRRVDAATGFITTVVGNGFGGFSGDNGLAAAASLNLPRDIAIDGSGNLFIADTFNHRIRKVNAATGVITTVAGNGSGSFSGDNGLAAVASLNEPRGIAVDGSGNLFIADAANHRIRRVNPATGIITTVAGNGFSGFSGDNGLAAVASLNVPYFVAVDSSGNLFIAEFSNHRIRKVNAATGVITTVAGNGFGGFSGDNGPAVSASLNSPRSIAIDGSGNLFIADTLNNRIRKVTLNASVNGIVVLSALPSSQTVTAGGSATYTVNLNRTNFTGLVALSVSGLPSGASSILNPISTTGNTSALTINTSSSTPAGAYSLTISGAANGASVSQTAATLIVNAALPADFTLGIGPQSQSAIAGESKSFTVSVQGLNGFTQSVSLSAAVNPPTGITAALTSSSVAPGNNVTLNINTAANTPPATYTITITGTAGQLVRTQTATLIVSAKADFTLSVSPDSRSVSAGQSTTYTVSVQAINGFSQSVNLSASVTPQTSNISFNFSSSSIAPGNSATMTVNANPSTATSAFTIIVTAASGQLVQSRPVTLNVSQTAASDFSLMVLPGSQSITAGTATSFMISVQAMGGFTQSVNLSASISPSNGVTTSFNTSTVAPGGNAMLTAASTTSTPPGVYAITITGAAGQLVRTAIATVNVMSSSASDFSLSAAPTSREITAGESTTFTVTVNKINGFPETVNLFAIPSPNDQNIRVDAVPPSVIPGGTTTLNVSTTQSLRAGAYTINIFGTAGQITKTAASIVNVAEQGYSLSFDKPEITVSPGEKASITVNINRGGGFNANVTVTPDPLKLKALTIKSTPPSGSSTGSSVTFSFKAKNKASPGRFELVFTGQDGRGGPPRPQTLIIFIK